MIFGYSQEAEAVGGTISDQTSCEAIDGDWRPDTPSVGINTCQLSVGLIIEDGEILRISDIVLRITSSDVGIIINNGGTLTNSGTIDINGGFELRIGTINNNNDGIINNRGPGRISINFGTFNNDGLILNKDDIITFGTAIIENSGTIDNDGEIFTRDRTTFNNSGEIINNRGIIINIDRSIITNSGTIDNDEGVIENGGAIFFSKIINSGTIDNSDGRIRNSATIENSGIIKNSGRGTIDNSGEIFNSATIDNSGTINNSEIFATINNSGDIGNSGTGIITNFGTINNGDPSETRSGRIDNFGTIENSGGTINNSEIFGTINNCGTINGEISGVQPNPICPTCDDDIIDPVIDLGETCDDGNTVPADGCSATCQTEAGFECTGEPSICTLLCGNSIVDPGEDCDDGNASNTDACLNTCQSASCGDSFVQAGVEECDPPSAGTCDLTCQFITSSSGTVVGTTEVPQFCGIKQLAVETPAVFDENIQPIIFDETVDLQASNEETLRVANTGGGAAEVNVDLTLLDSDGETTDWEDLLGATFDRSNTRSHHLSSQPFSSMTPITNNPFIDVLLGQTAPESEFVDRFLKVRPNVGDVAFSNAGTTLLTFTQILRLEVSCDPAASCPDTSPILLNGECVSEVGICTPGQTRPCGTSDVGVCQLGTQLCDDAGRFGSCTGNVEPTSEACDGLDNDCDGSIDEDGIDLCPSFSFCDLGVCTPVMD